MKVEIYRSDGTKVVDAVVGAAGDGLYSGTLTWLDEQLMPTFAEYEELVEGQVFSRIDRIEKTIAQLATFASLSGGDPIEIAELQVYPSTQAISFRQKEV